MMYNVLCITLINMPIARHHRLQLCRGLNILSKASLGIL